MSLKRNMVLARLTEAQENRIVDRIVSELKERYYTELEQMQLNILLHRVVEIMFPYPGVSKPEGTEGTGEKK